MSTATAKFTLKEYEHMISVGAFDTRWGHNIELLRGELRDMFPINPDHAEIVDYLTRWSFLGIAHSDVTVRIQGPICCPDDEAVPQPDVALLKPVKRRPWPLPEDVLLLIEVADSSLTGDQTEKAEIYARAGIADYWIVNIPNRQVEVYRQPENGAYVQTQVFKAGNNVTTLAFPNAQLDVSEMFATLEI